MSASAFSGILTYSTSGVGTKTVYRNNTPLPAAPSLQTEARVRMKVLADSTLGTADRHVFVLDLNNGAILGSATFDYLDGAFHTYRLVRDPSAATVRVFIDS